MTRRKTWKEREEEREDRLKKMREAENKLKKQCEILEGTFKICAKDRVFKGKCDNASTIVVDVRRHPSIIGFGVNYLFDVTVPYEEDGVSMRQLNDWLDDHFKIVRKNGIRFIKSEIVEQYDDTKVMKFKIFVDPRIQRIPMYSERIGD